MRYGVWMVSANSTDAKREGSRGSRAVVKSKILKCRECNRYTLKTICPACGSEALNPRPARYSPEDRYGVYRRRMKKFYDDRQT